jgi:hypothetical protein
VARRRDQRCQAGEELHWRHYAVHLVTPFCAVCRARHRKQLPMRGTAASAPSSLVAREPASAAAIPEWLLRPRLPPRAPAPPLSALAATETPENALKTASTLGAQVSLLDAARTALAAGAFTQTLALTDRYQREFPQGEPGPDAEVVALEALAAEGDGEALTERAARFLARYPTDPHAARVKSLAQ